MSQLFLFVTVVRLTLILMILNNMTKEKNDDATLAVLNTKKGSSENKTKKDKKKKSKNKKSKKDNKESKKRKRLGDDEDNSNNAGPVTQDEEKKEEGGVVQNSQQQQVLTDDSVSSSSSDNRRPKAKKHKKDKKSKKKKKKSKDSEKRSTNNEADVVEKRRRDEEIMKRNQVAETNAILSSTNTAVEKDESMGRVVASSAIEFYDPSVTKVSKSKTTKAKEAPPVLAARKHEHNLTLLLFYQYVEPVWDESTYEYMLTTLQKVGKDLDLTGRMRVAREGLNCTLTASHESILEYCNTLRRLRPKEFAETEFKLTTDLPLAQKFPNLKVFKVVELVHYGLEGEKAPPISKYHGMHLEPEEYHKKIAEPNTVIIDVRNHYEAAIGRFVPPQETKSKNETKDSLLPPPKWLDPKMRKSTEFPPWLDKPETREEMKGKQVLMYCTGGIRCERASALLKYKMETDPEIKALGIKGVYQLQGGIDKYFKAFPDGGYWHGKNYVFDKRFAHAPPKIDGELHGRKEESTAPEEKNETKDANKEGTASSNPPSVAAVPVMGKCEACAKPWDMYRGKRRCPTCGVPSLICKECFVADRDGIKKLGREVRCDLCVEQGITSKKDLRKKDESEIQEYENRMFQKGLLNPNKPSDTNPEGITRVFLRNMCRKNMDETTLLETFPGITHIVWRTDRQTGNFLGSGWVEFSTPEDAARAVAQDGIRLFGRPVKIAFQAPDGKDAWPPPNSAVQR